MQTLIYLLALGTVALDVLIVVVLIALAMPAWRVWLVPQVRQWALPLVLLLSLGACAGTLYLEYAGALVPCVLCWWQRIFMYPIILLAGLAFIKNEKVSAIADYILALSILGFFTALYQHALQMLPSTLLAPCDATADCATRSIFEFGFVTLPWMAVTVFAAIALIAVIARKADA